MARLGHVWIKEIARFSSRIDLYNFGRWLVLALMVGVVAAATLPRVAWRNWCYEVGGSALELRHGVVSRHHSIVPY